MAKQRYAGMDETGEYYVHGLAIQGMDVDIKWNCGYLTIGWLIQECNSFAEAEAAIEFECNCTFDHEEVHWSPSPGLPSIRRPIERSRR